MIIIFDDYNCDFCLHSTLLFLALANEMLSIVGLLVLVAAASLTRSQDVSVPNIIIVNIDDLPFLQQWSDYAPIGVELEGMKINYDSFPVPNMAKFLDEAVVFSRAYSGGPKCSTSRFSLLTGRQPSRSEEAVRKTLEESSGIWGPKISVPYTRIAGDDKRYNLPTLLQLHNGSPYYTGCVGKWHMMGEEDEKTHRCGEQEVTANSTTYDLCTALVEDVGFDVVGALYVGNIGTNDVFSHNPEWMV